MRSEQKGGEKGRRDERIWNAGLQSFWQVVVTFALADIFFGGGVRKISGKRGINKMNTFIPAVEDFHIYITKGLVSIFMFSYINVSSITWYK